jgi:ribonuclease HI
MSDSRPKVTIYTDGGCQPNPGAGGWAALLMIDGHARELSGGMRQTTNNQMELTAAISALEALKTPCEVALYTDSEYLKKGVTEWMAGWKRNGWKTASRAPVKNKELWERLDAALQRHKITWKWVKAHAGHEHNERVDQLATAARIAVLDGSMAETPAAPPTPPKQDSLL